MLKDSQNLVLLPPTAAGPKHRGEIPGGAEARLALSIHPSIHPKPLHREGSPCPQWFLPVLKGNSLNVVVVPIFTQLLHGKPGSLEGLAEPPSCTRAAPSKSRAVSNAISAPF